MSFSSRTPHRSWPPPDPARRSQPFTFTPDEIPVVLFNVSDRDRLIVRAFLVLGLRPGELLALRYGSNHVRQGRPGRPASYERENDIGALYESVQESLRLAVERSIIC